MNKHGFLVRVMLSCAVGIVVATVVAQPAMAARVCSGDCSICFVSDGNCDATDVFYDCRETTSGCETIPNTGCNGCDF